MYKLEMLLKISVSSAPCIVLCFKMDVAWQRKKCCWRAPQLLLHVDQKVGSTVLTQTDTTYVLVSQQQTRYLTYISAQLLVP